MRKFYEEPDFELIKYKFQNILDASAEGDPNQVVGDGDGEGGGPIT
ncbi:MAG: hypothetical protein UFA98_03825 [Ruminococcus sp.]|nr:hypothetical protein [Ruminococcus sp.]